MELLYTIYNNQYKRTTENKKTKRENNSNQAVKSDQKQAPLRVQTTVMTSAKPMSVTRLNSQRDGCHVHDVKARATRTRVCSGTTVTSALPPRASWTHPVGRSCLRHTPATRLSNRVHTGLKSMSCACRCRAPIFSCPFDRCAVSGSGLSIQRGGDRCFVCVVRSARE